MINSGIIMIWSGAVVNIPAGWVLCDGDNGTPNLLQRFIVGAGDLYNVGDNGGTIQHTHNFTGDGHSHDLTGGAQIQSGTDFDDVVSVEVGHGTTDLSIGLPPYYALAFIMKT